MLPRLSPSLDTSSNLYAMRVVAKGLISLGDVRDRIRGRQRSLVGRWRRGRSLVGWRCRRVPSSGGGDGSGTSPGSSIPVILRPYPAPSVLNRRGVSIAFPRPGEGRWHTRVPGPLGSDPVDSTLRVVTQLPLAALWDEDGRAKQRRRAQHVLLVRRSFLDAQLASSA